MSAAATWTPPEGLGQRLAEALLGHRFYCPNEATLQEAIANVFNEARIPFVRECRLSSRDRVDFLVGDGIAVEVKVDGSLSEVLRQLHRHAQHDDVDQIVLVTTRAMHKAGMPASLGGKPVSVVHLGGVV